MASTIKQLSLGGAKDLKEKLSSSKTVYIFFGPQLGKLKWLRRFNFGRVKSLVVSSSDNFRSDLMIYSWLGYKIVPIGAVARIRTEQVKEQEDLKFVIDKPNWLDKLALLCYDWTL
jgi:hypothetical protein